MDNIESLEREVLLLRGRLHQSFHNLVAEILNDESPGADTVEQIRELHSKLSSFGANWPKPRHDLLNSILKPAEIALKSNNQHRFLMAMDPITWYLQAPILPPHVSREQADDPEYRLTSLVIRVQNEALILAKLLTAYLIARRKRGK